MGVARLDNASLETQAEFAALLERAPQVEGIFCGHVHQDCKSPPATCH
eukprot:COSAG04_NODE_152_length_22459_cov_12.374597_4_plen_48_part_00